MRQQPDLFASPATRSEPPPPNLANIRKSLTAYLRMVRDAEILPWGPTRTEQMSRHFPALARALPDEEREALCRDFASELDRLGFRLDNAA